MGEIIFHELIPSRVLFFATALIFAILCEFIFTFHLQHLLIVVVPLHLFKILFISDGIACLIWKEPFSPPLFYFCASAMHHKHAEDTAPIQPTNQLKSD